MGLLGMLVLFSMCCPDKVTQKLQSLPAPKDTVREVYGGRQEDGPKKKHQKIGIYVCARV